MFTTAAEKRLKELQSQMHLNPGEQIEVRYLIEQKYAYGVPAVSSGGLQYPPGVRGNPIDEIKDKAYHELKRKMEGQGLKGP